MKKYSSNKDINNIVRSLAKTGSTVRPGKKHRSLISPEGVRLTIPSTPSDRRALDNFGRDVRYISQQHGRLYV